VLNRGYGEMRENRERNRGYGHRDDSFFPLVSQKIFKISMPFLPFVSQKIFMSTHFDSISFIKFINLKKRN